MANDRRRPAPSLRLRMLGAIAVMLGLALPLAPGSWGATSVPPASGAPTIITAITAITASAASDASRASRDARALRRETAELLTGYLTEYGNRFTAAENDELRAFRADADRKLAGVVVTTRRLQSLVAADAPRSQVLAAGRAAQRAHARARTAAQTSYDGARRIMEPRLSLFEGIAAIREYDAMLGRFDDLGDRIDAVVATVD